MALFSLLIVYENNASVFHHCDDLLEATGLAKSAIETDADVAFVQVSGSPFGPTLFEKHRTPVEREADFWQPADIQPVWGQKDVPKGVYYSPARGAFGSWQGNEILGRFKPIENIGGGYSSIPDAWKANKRLFPAPPDETNYSLNKAMETQRTRA